MPIAMHLRPILATALLLLAPLATAQPPGDGFDVAHYHVSLRPDLATGALSGRQRIQLRSGRDDLRRLVFSANALEVLDATLDGAALAVEHDRDGLAFVLPRPLSAGETATLAFRIRGTPARGVETTVAGLYTSYFACDWMVCLQDRPGDRAHLSMDLHLPPGKTSLGTGEARPLRASTDGLVLHRWRTTRPYPAYLFGFAAGDFAQASTRTRAGLFTWLDATGTSNDLPALFRQTGDIAAFFADRAGLPLPDRRYAQLLVPARVAQEAATFSLVGVDELARERERPDQAWVIAHELAHQWWGNLVTCESWQHFWLNEGITTFMVAAWKAHAFGDAAYRAELDIARQRLARARAEGYDKPLAWAGTYPSLATRRAIQYGKGALFLDHLRGVVGERAFWSGLRRFTRRHAGDSVDSRDFQRAMEQASGRALDAVFDEWVHGTADARDAADPP